MKSIKNYLETCLNTYDESLLDDDDIFLNPENDKNVVKEWIKNHYKITGILTISDDFVVDCSSHVAVKNLNIESLTNSLFRWGTISGFFDCSNCKKLISLEGAPKMVISYFACNWCEKLTSLEGAPKVVVEGFDCRYCKNLTSLKGGPEKVMGYFACDNCDNLTSLEGTPKEVSNFYCRNCNKITSLKGAPEWVGGDFYCGGCPNLKITKSDRKKYKIEN